MDEGERLDAFLKAQGAGDDATAERLLKEAPTDALRRLLELRRAAHAKRATPESQETVEPGLPFERLGDYRLLRRIGEGGMGQLFVAEQVSLGRRVALKVIQQALLGSPTARERFRREALAAARLHHPNLVTVFASSEESGVAYIAMEYVRGRGMDALIRESRDDGARIGSRRVVRWGARLARALAYAHDRGVLHRDLKPSNIVIKDDDEPVLLDFGIARDARWTGRTVTEAFTGSLSYAAPEQLAGRTSQLDGRVDVYGLAVTLYEALTGRLPVPGGSSLEALLTNEAVPPRRYNPSLSPDLQTVLLKALDKRPDARYADASAFADDLEAILELRPIAARPPRGLDRIRRVARRHPRATVLVCSALAALVLFSGYLVHARNERVLEQQREARRLVAAAETRLARYQEDQRGLIDLEKRIVELQQTQHMRFSTHEDDEVLAAGERRISAARRDREAAYHEALELLRRAGELDPDLARVDSVRTDLYMQRWRDAHVAQDREAAIFFRDLVHAHDREGRHSAELDGICRVNVQTDPPDAEVHLFRLVEQAEVVDGGERRFVPVPANPDAARPVDPGTFALRVVSGPDGWNEGDLIVRLNGQPLRDALFVLEDAGDLRRGDRVLDVNGELARAGYPLPGAGDEARTVRVARGEQRIEARMPNSAFGDARALAERGGVAAEVFRNGRSESATLPAGLQVRLTAVPVFVSKDTLWTRTPSGDLSVTRGRWLLVVRRPGFREMRKAFDTRFGWKWPSRMDLIAAGKAQEGWARIHSDHGGIPSFWIMEHEVTAAEYLEFLNDPATLARIDASDKRILFPRDRTPEAENGYWVREEGGRYRLAEDWDPEWPVLGVNWYDAVAYAQWRTRRARANGRNVTFALPNYKQWIRAGNGDALADYPFGDQLRPKWVCSCFARPTPAPQRVMSYPIDESINGVFDLAGSAAEWLDDWYQKENELRRIGGGSWAHGDPEHLKLYGQGFKAEVAHSTVGFRLVMVEDE